MSGKSVKVMCVNAFASNKDNDEPTPIERPPSVK